MMLKLKQLLFILLVLAQTSFHKRVSVSTAINLPDEDYSLLYNLKPQENAAWLKEYNLLTETVTPDHWETDKKLKFDSTGIVT